MPLLPAFLLMAQAVSSQTIDVPIINVRPSKLLTILQQLPATKAQVVADDEKSMLTLTGSFAEINEIRTRIGLFDVKRQMVDLDLHVVSPIDHAEWNACLTLQSNLKWTGTDESTGARLALSPRRNDDGTVTVMIVAESPDHQKIQSAVRLKLNDPVMFGVPNKGHWVTGPGVTVISGLQITLTAVDRSKKG